MNIYFVCTGNTCRSPMAEAILKSKNLDNVSVRSAGIFAMEGGEMSENAKLALANEGIFHNHISHSVTSEDLQWADIVLTMTAAHREIILERFPNDVGKIYTLKEYVTPYSSPDVSDPYGGDLPIYVQTYQELNKYLDVLVEKIRGGNL